LQGISFFAERLEKEFPSPQPIAYQKKSSELKNLIVDKKECKYLKWGINQVSEWFVERKREQSELLQLLNAGATPSKRLIVLVGAGGSGKSQIAKSIFNTFTRMESEFHYVWLCGSQNGNILGDLYKLFNTCEITYDVDQLESAVDTLYERYNSPSLRWIWVLDNVKDLKSNKGHQIVRALIKYSNVFVIITSENKKLCDNAHFVEIGKLTEDEAIKLVDNNIDIKETGQNVIKLCRKLCYFPLTLCQAVAYINGEQKISTYGIHHYCQDFDINPKTLLMHPFNVIEDPFQKTTLDNWVQTLEHIRSENEYGPYAYYFLNFIAFLDASGIEERLFSEIYPFVNQFVQRAKLQPETQNEVQLIDSPIVSIERKNKKRVEVILKNTIDLLLTFSLMSRNENTLKLNRILQIVTQIKVDESEDAPKIITMLANALIDVEKPMELEDHKKRHALEIQNHINKYDNIKDRIQPVISSIYTLMEHNEAYTDCLDYIRILVDTFANSLTTEPTITSAECIQLLRRMHEIATNTLSHYSTATVALQFFSKAVFNELGEIRKAIEIMDAQHPERDVVVSNFRPFERHELDLKQALSMQLLGNGEFAQAEYSLRDVVQQRRGNNSPQPNIHHHPSTRSAMYCLAECYTKQEKYSEAKQLYEDLMREMCPDTESAQYLKVQEEYNEILKIIQSPKQICLICCTAVFCFTFTVILKLQGNFSVLTVASIDFLKEMFTA
jgi:hypothetical protein